MTSDRQLLEVELEQPFRLLRGQELRIADTGLRLRKVALTRQEPATGFEELGDEYTLTLEASVEGAVKRRSFSWREHDDNDVCASWVVGDLVIAVDRNQVFRVTRTEEPVETPLQPPAPTPATGVAGTAAGDQLDGRPATGTAGEPPGSAAPGRHGHRELVRVRKRRKKRRRRPMEKLLDTLRWAVKVVLATTRSRRSSASTGQSRHRHHHHRRSSSDGQVDMAKLTFEQKIGWAWSLRVLEGEHTIGVVRGASPLTLVAMVEDYLAAFGGPRPGCSVVLGNLRTHHEVTLDRETIDKLRSERADEVLVALDRDYPHHTHRDSASLTVMTDEHGQTVRADDLFARVFDPRAVR